MDDLADEALADEGDYQNKPAEGEDEILPPTFPARINVTIEKPNSGALLVQAVIQDGDLQIEEISHFKNAEIATAQTAEKDWSRQSFYAGPPAENLDPELLAFWGRYLEERGLNLEFQNMVTDYIAFKEQKEYVRWLDSEFTRAASTHGIYADLCYRRPQVRCCLNDSWNLNLSLASSPRGIVTHYVNFRGGTFQSSYSVLLSRFPVIARLVNRSALALPAHTVRTCTNNFLSYMNNRHLEVIVEFLIELSDLLLFTRSLTFQVIPSMLVFLESPAVVSEVLDANSGKITVLKRT